MTLHSDPPRPNGERSERASAPGEGAAPQVGGGGARSADTPSPSQPSWLGPSLSPLGRGYFFRLYAARPEGQQQFVKFCFVGGIGFVVDAGSFTLMTSLLGVDLITGRFISAAGFGMTTTWLLNRSLTFRNHRRGRIWTEYLRFAFANGLGLLVNIGTHTVLVENVAVVHEFPILGIVAGTALGLVFNFTSSKYFVFRKTRQAAPLVEDTP